MLLRLPLLLLFVAILTVAVVAALMFAAALRHDTPAEVVLHSYKQQYSSPYCQSLFISNETTLVGYTPWDTVAIVRRTYIICLSRAFRARAKPQADINKPRRSPACV